MRYVLMIGAALLVVSTIAVDLAGGAAATPSSVGAAEADIVVRFRGLMVFDKETEGAEQVVRLHSDADHHKVTIRIKGPGFVDPLDWGHAYPKGAALKLDVVNRDGSLPPSASWATRKPYSISDLHPKSDTPSEFCMVPGAFGPTFTFHAGTFSSGGDVPIEFVSTVRTVYGMAPKFVVATIHLRGDEQMGLLTGAGLLRLPLRKPKVGEPKWEIEISNEPDLAHVCGYHFIHYYDGFRFRNGTHNADVPPDRKFVAKPTSNGPDPCDDPQTLGFDLGQRHTSRLQLTTFRPVSSLTVLPALSADGAAGVAIPTRPCIPISH